MLNYQIALCNVFWDEQNIDTRYFGSVEEQTQYFETLTEGLYSPFRNVKWGNGVELSLVYTENTGRSIQEVLHCNYAIIKELDDQGTTLNYRYYFAYPKHDAGNNYIVDLSLDDIQTNYFKYKEAIASCLINRAHLNRFYPNPDNVNELIVNMRDGDPFLQADGVDTIKVLRQRLPIKFEWTGDTALDNWLHENVLAWVYIYCDKTKVYKNVSGEFTNVSYTKLKNGELLNNDYGIFAYPLYRTTELPGEGTKIIIRAGDTYDEDYSWGETSESFLRELNNDTTYFYNKKISVVPPFIGLSNYTITNDKLIINGAGLTPSNSIKVGQGYITTVNTTLNELVIMHSLTDYGETYTGKVEGLQRPVTIINKNDWSIADAVYQPLYSGNYQTIRLKGFGGVEFDYDLLKIGNNPIEFEYSEALTPTITKYYLRLKPVGLYDTTYTSDGGNDTNYLGLVGSVDTTIAVSNDQYASFLANNKNFWMQSSIKWVWASNALNTGGNPVDIVRNGMSTAGDILNTTLTLDNMKNAPDAFSNASGDIIFNGKVDTLGFYVELWDTDYYSILLNRNYFKQYGFKYNNIGYIGGVDNIRNRYNYVSAEVNVISAPINELEKERLREKLSSVRFWNRDTINYVGQNLEKIYWEDIDE